MSDFIQAAKLDDLAPGVGTVVIVDGKSVALFNVDGTIYAMEDTCPHQGSSLGMGQLEGSVVKCRGHGMRFSVVTGLMPGSESFGVKTYPVEVVDGKIMVDVSSTQEAV